MSGSPVHRILVLDDGETWEVISPSSNALVIDVTPAEAQRLHDGDRVADVLGGRTGRRIASLVDGISVSEW